ncbi:bifunctional pyridoxamine 5'-phosphate oxidase family protein/GNAT family N-acetyltransferase [Micromonospora sp. CPCC 206061]|uniref:bifunctional pyridoxamine 5'-phosphate oxidase family protein/GNAT family N-acetyltransferase n=1 Tax=Micromonospora sp. CPCC 206061 TaxID=3122410 RepID=UPI002FF33A83
MYEQTHRTTANRDRGRVGYERATAHAILDEAVHCHFAFTVDGEPRLLPTLHVRVGETLYLHGSTGSRPLLAARGDAGLPICVTATLLDGLVYARSHTHHSANYRSVVAHGTARLVADEAEKRIALDALVEKVGRGRAADSRPPNRKELAEVAVLALPLSEVSVKARAGGVIDEEEDYALPHWAGVVPLRLVPGIPEPDAGVHAPVPDYLRAPRSPWLTPVPLHGSHVVLEPLDMSHVDGLFSATRDPAVWQYLTQPQPQSVDGIAEFVAEALRANQRGERVPWVQRDAVTGEIIGTTSYYFPDERFRTMEIGGTFLGRRWWRTGVNTEAKLLLLTHAFESLDAIRVTWQTDIRNERSQAAIARLGATREGVLRANRRRADRSWRDSVLYSMTANEWPSAQARLREMVRSRAAAA